MAGSRSRGRTGFRFRAAVIAAALVLILASLLANGAPGASSARSAQVPDSSDLPAPPNAWEGPLPSAPVHAGSSPVENDPGAFTGSVPSDENDGEGLQRSPRFGSGAAGPFASADDDIVFSNFLDDIPSGEGPGNDQAPLGGIWSIEGLPFGPGSNPNAGGAAAGGPTGSESPPQCGGTFNPCAGEPLKDVLTELASSLMPFSETTDLLSKLEDSPPGGVDTTPNAVAEPPAWVLLLLAACILASYISLKSLFGLEREIA